MNTAPGVCALGWVKYREQNFTAGYTLYNHVCKKNKKKKIKTDILDVHVKDVWVMEDVLCATCQHVLIVNIPGKYRLITVAQHNRPVLQF